MGTDRFFGLAATLADEPDVAHFEALTATQTLVAHGREFLDEPGIYPAVTTNPMKPLAS